MRFFFSTQSIISRFGPALILTFFPLITLAQPSTLNDLVAIVINLINIIIPTIFAFLFFFLCWKVIDSWIIHAGDESKREDGKRYALTAVVVFVIALSAWGIVAMIRTSIFGVN